MSTALATTTGSALAITPEQDFWTDKQVAALNQLGVDKASKADLAVFFHQVTRTGLDPFARQIYMIERKGKQTIQTGIDGFRLIARRATDAAHGTFGYEDTQWCGEDGQWTDVWLKKEQPRAAKVTVIRDGQRYPAIALWDEYVGTKFNGEVTQMWSTKGALMLAKCAEALALRKAFPQDLSGIYTADEMQQADNGNHATPVQSRPQQSRPAPKSSADVARAALGMNTEPARDVDAEAQKLAADIANAGTKDELRALWTAAGTLTPDYTASLRANCDAKAADLDALAAAEQAQAEENVQTVLDAEIIPEQSAA
jgi:phage recombination protein Bet